VVDIERARSSGAGIVIGAVIGLVVGFVVGVFVFRWAATFGGVDGWEDLVSVVEAMFSTAPVGALVGGALGAQRNGRWLWTDMSRRQRWSTLATGFGLAIVAGVIGAVRTDAMSGVFIAVWAFPVGAVIGYLVGRGGRATTDTSSGRDSVPGHRI
jgi:H+/Cl- antiporter ClcA